MRPSGSSRSCGRGAPPTRSGPSLDTAVRGYPDRAGVRSSGRAPSLRIAMLRIVLVAAVCLGIVLAVLALSAGPRRTVLPVGEGAAGASSEDALLPLTAMAAQRAEAEPGPLDGAALQPVQKLVPKGPGRRRAAGRVFDPAGRPARAELLLVRPGGAQQRKFLKNQGRLFETDRDGRFLFECDSRGEFDLFAIDNRTGWARVSLGADAWPEDIEIQLAPLPYVRGRLVGADGTPRAAVSIELSPERLDEPTHPDDELPADLRRTRIRRVRPDGEGRFAIGPLAPGEYQLTVETAGPSDDGYLRWFASHPPGEAPVRPTSVLVRADLDPEREVLVRHDSTEVWIRWFDSTSSGGALVLHPWTGRAMRRGDSPTEGGGSADARLYLDYRVLSESSWTSEAVRVEPDGIDGSETFALAVRPQATLNVHGIGRDLPLVSAAVTAPPAGQRLLVDIAIPPRTRMVPVCITAVPPEGALLSSTAAELRRLGDRGGPGLPLLWESGVPFDLAEGCYALHLTANCWLGPLDTKTVEREVALDLRGRDEFHTTVDFGP